MSIDRLAALMVGLIGFVVVTLGWFSARYLAGDRHQQRFYWYLVILAVLLCISVCASNVLIFAFGLLGANMALVRLMAHKKEWQAARVSSQLARNNFVAGFIAIMLAVALLYSQTGSFSLSTLLSTAPLTLPIRGALALLFVGAMTQSALWPFHTWLLSSLNSPTPVSALMHAGLINGGGFILARFAPLYVQDTLLLQIIFTFGMISALIGTLFKLMQPSIKRMLACSTMGQMGFMIAQCGAGFFAAAVAHLCWHGLFKAYLFLFSGQAAQERRVERKDPSITVFLYALFCGFAGMYSFSVCSGKKFVYYDTTLIMLLVAFIATAQAVMPLLSSPTDRYRYLQAPLISSSFGGIYGVHVSLISWFIAPVVPNVPQQLSAVYIGGACILVMTWLCLVFQEWLIRFCEHRSWYKKLYVLALNASQPLAKTVTAHRRFYKI